jgi:hypothetical protein
MQGIRGRSPSSPGTGALEIGIRHGLYCLGRALFAVLVAAGVMSLAWMLLLTLAGFAEKRLPSAGRFRSATARRAGDRRRERRGGDAVGGDARGRFGGSVSMSGSDPISVIEAFTANFQKLPSAVVLLCRFYAASIISCSDAATRSAS